jgi:surface protein
MKNLDQYISESLKGYKPGAIKPKEQLIEDCSGYFENQEVDVDKTENFDTSEVIDMNSMFYKSVFSLDGLDLSSWDVSNVEDMSYMFGWSNVKILDLSSWDVSNVKNMRYMFADCRYLESLDLSSWDTSKVKNVDYIFLGCYNLTNIKFSPSLGSNKTPLSLSLCSCGERKGYKLSDETYESMLTMYDRKKAGLSPMEITFNRKHNIPDGWKVKMKERGYDIKYKNTKK